MLCYALCVMGTGTFLFFSFRECSTYVGDAYMYLFILTFVLLVTVTARHIYYLFPWMGRARVQQRTLREAS